MDMENTAALTHTFAIYCQGKALVSETIVSETGAKTLLDGLVENGWEIVDERNADEDGRYIDLLTVAGGQVTAHIGFAA